MLNLFKTSSTNFIWNLCYLDISISYFSVKFEILKSKSMIHAIEIIFLTTTKTCEENYSCIRKFLTVHWYRFCIKKKKCCRKLYFST